MNRHHDRIDIRHAFGKACVDVGGFDAANTRPFGYCVGCAINCDSPVAALVVGLLNACRPAAVLFAIAKVVVDSVKRHTLWTWGHIVSKVGKTLTPPVAHSNATSAVMRKHIVCLHMASGNHVFPRLALPVHIGSAVRVAVGQASLLLLGYRKATARCDSASLDFRGNGFALSTACAFEKPNFKTGFVAANRLDCCEFAKNLTRNVRVFIHGVHCTATRLIVRKHSLYTFAKAVKSGDDAAIASCLGHALRTGSYRHMRQLLNHTKSLTTEEVTT